MVEEVGEFMPEVKSEEENSVSQNEDEGNNNETTQESLESTFRKSSTRKRKETKNKSPSNKKKLQLFQEKQEKFMETCTDVLKRKDNVTDEFDAIGVNVSAKLRKMDLMQQVLVESLISKILAKGLFKELTRLTDVSDPHTTNNTPSWPAAPSTVYAYSSGTTSTLALQPIPQPQPSRSDSLSVLKGEDLASTSAKRLRQELEDELDEKLHQSRKKEIDDLVMEFVSSKKDEGKKYESEDMPEEEHILKQEDSKAEKKKKRGSTGKKPSSVAKKTKKGFAEVSANDASEGEFEEMCPPKKASKPAKTRKLSPKKKKAGSDCSESDEDRDKKEGGKKGPGTDRKGGDGYTKPLQLSPELSALVGAESMSRIEVMKKVWSIVKKKNLYDPNNKQYAICDDALLKVIGTKRFRTFCMMKYLKNHFIG